MLKDKSDDRTKTATASAQNSDAPRPGCHPNSLANLERHKFKPGQSGNPGGRPKKIKAIADRALDHADEMLDVFIEIARDKTAPHATRIAAAKEVMDRGPGKPAQAIDINQETRHTLSEEFEAYVRELNNPANKELQALQDKRAKAVDIDFSDLDD